MNEIRRSARFSEDGTRRVTLERAWGEENTPYVLFCMLNPSTANAEVDDPTIRRCMKYVRDWGYTRLRVVNLFDLISPDPAALRAWVAELGPAKTSAYQPLDLGILEAESHYAVLTVCGWGTWGGWFPERVAQVLPLLSRTHALHVTKAGHPGHPLYLAADARPIPYPR